VGSLTLEHLCCDFHTPRGRVRAVEDLCLSVHPGELLVLVGPSGCGKTTTLRALAGLVTPTKGVIRMDGRVVNECPPRDRDVAMVFQGGALYPHMTVYRNLAFGLRMRRVPQSRIDEAVAAVAASLNLTPLLDRKPDQLSGGERQRVALGRAMVRKPRLFLLDEPLSYLDARMQAAARAEIKRLQRELATTMVYVTHDQEEAMTLADRIGVLQDGRLQQLGPPADIYDRPANLFVAGFFGSPSMNFLAGRLEGRDGKVRLLCGGVPVPLPDDGDTKRLAGRDVVLGVRPHDVKVVAATDGLQAIIRSVDFLGDAVLFHVSTPAGCDWVVKSTVAGQWEIGAQVGLVLRAGQIHLFSSDASGVRLR
jgi:multiple sugar transport system ATP-binding protein